ncbi:chorismate mutase [Mycobacterium sp. IS-2888]|uniref:chorismate mutase n=1 Tax=Mycobacterium sp. IS-2888 TaxID=1834159 RepID=UPI0009FA7510|nr:chorismate mutase [Mycobacterium sp. IS-2888]
MVRRSSALRVVLIAAPAVLVATLAPQARGDSALTELVDAAAQRLQLAEPVAAVKWRTHGAIEDPGRAEQELAKLGAEATARHVDPDYVTQVFRDQIHATEAIEYSRFAGWKLDPSNLPAAAPDLPALRGAIDALNQTMLTQIAANWGLLHSPACGPQLDTATSGVISARQLDGVDRQALSLATSSYCQG